MVKRQSVPGNEAAVSEVVGSILLISVVVIGVGIVGVVMMSHSTPQKVPALSAVISEETGQKMIYIYHDGGDPLSRSDIQILVDGTAQTFSNDGSTDWSTWSMGQSLSYQYSGSDPDRVQIIYTGGSSSAVLASSQFTLNPSGGTTTATTTATATTTTTVPTTNTTTATPTPTAVPAPVANFVGTPVNGTAPLTVQFTDLSTNSPTSWLWDFGDGNFTGNATQNPSHTYTSVGTYTVKLTITNAGGNNSLTRTNYIQTTISNFTSYVIQKNVFVYGTKLYFAGDTVIGPGATVIIMGPLTTSDLNGGTSLSVTTIYVNGDITMDSGSAALGSSTSPGTISVNGNLNLNGGTRDIYGEVYVAKSMYLENCRIHGNVYVNGDLTLNWGVPTIDSGKYIYYTGTLSAPSSYDSTFLARCIKVSSVPAVTMPDLTLASVKSSSWYTAHGYSSGGTLTSNLKVFADSYSSTTYQSSASNVVIVAANGDITLTGLGSSGVTGVLYAPKGKVTFEGGYFTGVVLARDGFYVTSGGTTVTFTNLANYFTSSDDYPF